MRKFILRATLVILPFIVLGLFTKMYYSSSEGPDLLRIGYIPKFDRHYLSETDRNREQKFLKLSNAAPGTFDILTIGDSFSEQEGYGYKNFISANHSVLHVDRFISKNQFQTLIGLVNGDFFSKFKVKYVILQSVERQLSKNIQKLDYNAIMNIEEIDSVINHNSKSKNLYGYQFFSPITIKFPLYYFPQYILKTNYLSNNLVYNVVTKSDFLFSNRENNLLFYNDDMIAAKLNNEKENVRKLNSNLNYIANRLKQKDITLIFLLSADKFNFYYDQISNKSDFEKPMITEEFSKLDRDFRYIDSKTVMMPYLQTIPDLYFYGDTHWSPNGSRIIAKEINTVISDN